MRARLYGEAALLVLAALVVLAAPAITYRCVGQHPAGLLIVAALLLLAAYAPAVAAVGLWRIRRDLRRLRILADANKVARDCAALEQHYQRNAR